MLANVSYTWGREGVTTYNESHAGRQKEPSPYGVSKYSKRREREERGEIAMKLCALNCRSRATNSTLRSTHMTTMELCCHSFMLEIQAYLAKVIRREGEGGREGEREGERQSQRGRKM